MADRIKQIPVQILEWWKKFSTKQKAAIVSSTAVVIVALVILGVVLSIPKMEVVKECENTKQASQVQALLNENGIMSEVSDDGLTFYVRKEDKTKATFLLAENNITPYDYDWEKLNNVFSGGFSVTEADKSKRYQLYMQNDLEEKLESMENIEEAHVTLNVPRDTGTLISRDEESSAWVVLTLNEEMDERVAQGLGRAIATALGNETTANVMILDSTGNTLFGGGETNTSIEKSGSNLELKSKTENIVATQVRKAMMETHLYNSVSVALNLDIDYEESTVRERIVGPAEGMEAGIPTQERRFSYNGTGTDSYAPGTDGNDNTGYVTGEDGIGTFEQTDDEIIYDISERETNTIISTGKPNYENSSISVVASTYRIYNEREMRATNQLDGMSFEEFVAQNNQTNRLEVDPELITMVSRATGIPEAQVNIVAYEVPMFDYARDEARSVVDYLPIVLAALIMLMLGFVVFRSTRKEAEPELEVEPELSVEALLESTREAEDELEDIGFTEKSETRVLIERFVDENPEAAASLLRNWLNEEWE